MTISGHGKDMTGTEVGRLKVIEFADNRITGSGRHENFWKCRCKCGNEVILSTSTLRSAITNNRMISCGCYVSERAGNLHKTHGLRHTRLKGIYQGMLSRCYTKTDPRYIKYGERGIYVCDEWRSPPGSEGNPGFLAFYKWAYENGYKDPEPGEDRSTILSLERKDVNGPYAPWNCKWIPYGKQAMNRRNTKRIYDGQKWFVHSEFEDHYGWPRATVHAKLKAGWTPSAVVYAAKHPELKLRKMRQYEVVQKQCPENSYIDKDGFMHMIPIIPQEQE